MDKKYKELTARTFSDKDLNGQVCYLHRIIELDTDKTMKETESELVKAEKKHLNRHLWTLLGKNNEDKDWVCLQTAATEGNIIEEIREDIEFMYGEKTEEEAEQAKPKVSVNTQFYFNTYEIPEGERRYKRKYSYQKMRKDYDILAFYSIDIDKYLGLDRSSGGSEIIDEIVQVAKMNYAEARFAYETQAVYWNAYRSGVDMKALRLWLSRLQKSVTLRR